MILRETTQADMEFMAKHSIIKGEAKYRPERIDYVFTLEHEKQILATGGFRMINLYSAWCWTDWTPLMKEHVVAGYRIIKEWMEIFAQDHKLKRLQAYIEYDFSEAIRMAQHLGFKRESVMKNFLGDKDAFMYVRLF